MVANRVRRKKKETDYLLASRYFLNFPGRKKEEFQLAPDTCQTGLEYSYYQWNEAMIGATLVGAVGSVIVGYAMYLILFAVPDIISTIFGLILFAVVVSPFIITFINIVVHKKLLLQEAEFGTIKGEIVTASWLMIRRRKTSSRTVRFVNYKCQIVTIKSLERSYSHTLSIEIGNSFFLIAMMDNEDDLKDYIHKYKILEQLNLVKGGVFKAYK
jgi:hypothetical protein